MASASRKAGLRADFPRHIEEALEVLCRSLHDEAKLHWFGRMNTWLLAVTGLAGFLEVEKAFRDDPSLATTKLEPPVIVLGLPRSGTTFLHRLLGASEDAASVALYQYFYPVPTGPVDLRRLNTTLTFEPWRLASGAYQMDAMHLIRSELPDECNWGMRVTGRSMIYWSAAPAYSYLRWLLGQDLRETYQFYRKMLLINQRSMPGKRLTLKCPYHGAWLPALREALPEAHLVQTNRDPLETVPSDCKLTLSMQCMATPTLDLRQSVEHVVMKDQTFAERMVAFADTDEGKNVHHVDYRRLVKDPVGVAAELHTTLGLPFSTAHESALRGYATENKQYKHGRNQYNLESFGLNPATIKQGFKAYRERFIES